MEPPFLAPILSCWQSGRPLFFSSLCAVSAGSETKQRRAVKAASEARLYLEATPPSSAGAASNLWHARCCPWKLTPRALVGSRSAAWWRGWPRFRGALQTRLLHDTVTSNLYLDVDCTHVLSSPS